MLALELYKALHTNRKAYSFKYGTRLNMPRNTMLTNDSHQDFSRKMTSTIFYHWLKKQQR